MKILRIFGFMLTSAGVFSLGQQTFAQIDLDNEDNRIAYSIGANIGHNLQAQQIVEGIDLDVFLAGMKDAIEGDTQIDQDAMMQAIQTFMQRQADEESAALAENLASSEAFLANNASKAGVTAVSYTHLTLPTKA